MRKIKANVCVMVLMLTALIFAGCGEDKKELRIGYFPNITHSQALMMREQGNLEKSLEGQYEVEWVSFNAGPAETEAFFAGELDIGFIGPVPAISAYIKSQGDFVVISGAANGGASLVAAKDSGIESVADLDGKKVAVPQLGNTQHLMLLGLLKENQLLASNVGGTVEVVAATNADILNLIEQGQIDAALVPQPWGSIILQNGTVKLVTEGKGLEEISNQATTVILVSKDYLEEDKEAVEAFLKEYYAVTEYAAAGSKEAKEMTNKRIQEETGKEFSQDIIDEAFESIRFSTEVSMGSLSDYAQILYDEEFIIELPDEGLIWKMN